jgi:RimJ/RimL family protein N-acetyltransferase
MRLQPSYPVRSSRLLLRPLVRADADALTSYRSLPEVCRWVPFEPMGLATVKERIVERWSKTTLDSEGDTLFLGVELAKTGELVGDVMLHFTSELHRSGEIGYVFHPDHSGHGYATEAAHTLLHLAFDDLGLHRVVARVDTRNDASVRVLERLGMRREARLRENEWFKGGWSDEYDYGLLEEEWAQAHESGCPYRL